VKETTIARNYAEALLAAAEGRGGDAIERFGELLDGIAGAVASDARIALALESPRVAKATKVELLAAAFEDLAPTPFVRFLQAVVRRGRQGLFAEMAVEYQGLVDLKLNRVHAGVTLATQPDTALQEELVARLAAALGKEVRARFRADSKLLGGVVVRVGDRIYDGSVRRRLNTLRRAMLTAD
jgi:F-type H+-transporting ATPase subunit delta